MKKSTFKRALTLVLCLAIFIASVPFAAVSAATPSNVIIDNFDGAENWESKTGEASYLMSRFNPPNTSLHVAGTMDIFTHKNWPDRKLVSVEGTYLNTYWGSLFVYDYEDENNWRGFYMQKATNQNFYWLLKETDSENPNIVYYYKSAASEAYFWQNHIEAGSLSTFKLDYKEDNTITFTHIGYDDPTLTNTQVLPTGEFAVAENKLGNLKVSTDGGETFEAATETHTFAGIENVRDCEFAIGSGSSADTYLDNLVITFEKSTAEYVQDFRTTHATILAKTVAAVTADDLGDINAAIADYDVLTNDAKALLTEESELLSAMAEKIVAAQFDVSSFTDDFSGDNYWAQVGDGENGTITNEEFYPGAPTDLVNGKTSVHAHKYWPERAINSVSGELHIVYHTPVTIYYYKDANNWRGFFYQSGSNLHGRYIMKESDPNNPNKVYYYYSTTNNKHGFIAKPTDNKVNFDISYDSNSSITYKATIYKGTENEVTNSVTFGAQETVTADKLMVSTDGGKNFAAATEGYTFSALTDAKSSQFAMGYTVNAGGYFDNLTFTFDKSDEEVVAEYKATHAVILAKTVDTVLAGDEAAIKTALADYEELSSGAKTLLATEKALLDSLENKVVVEKFNADSFTDDFEGDNNWVQVGSGAEGTIVSGEYYPGASTNLTGNISVHTHKYWPARQLKKVSGDYRTAALSSLVIYYYKDANNWRGFYSHNGSQRHVRFVMKATDAATGNVYFWYSNSNDIASIAGITNNPMAFELIYEDDATIKLRLDGQERLDTISNARTSRDGQTFVSTDGGQSFAAMSGTYTFPALTDAKSAKFAMGNGQNSSRFDNLTIEFERAPEDVANEFLAAHAGILAKDEASITMTDKAAILAAIEAYDALPSGAKALLTNEYALLTAMSDALYADLMNGTTYTEDFEGDYLWKAEGGSAPANVIKDVDGNKVFAPGGVGSVSAPVAYSHRYWQDKLLTSVTGKMYIAERSLSSTVPSNVIIYSYQDADNWRGIYFTNFQNADGSDFSQPIKFIGKEDGRLASYYEYKIKGNPEFKIEGQVTQFTITYNANGTATMLLTNETGSSIEINLLTWIRGFENGVSFLKHINANYGEFGVGSLTSASADDWFDDITFTFGDTKETKLAEFKTIYADTLALNPATITNNDKAAIVALYDAYNKITRDSYMAEALASEGVKIDAFIEQLKEINKNTTGVVRIALVGDSNTESGAGLKSDPLPARGYPGRLQTLLDATYGAGKFLVGNFGISGKQTNDYYQSVYDGDGEYSKRGMLESLFFDPDVVIIAFGTNDALNNSSEVFEYYYEKLADEYTKVVSKEHFVATTVIHTFHSCESNAPARRASTKRLATENGWGFFDLYADTYDYLSTHQEVYDSAGLHPWDGYQSLAQAAHDFIAENIADDFGVEELPPPAFDQYEDIYTASANDIDYNDLARINEALAFYASLTPAQQAGFATQKAALDNLKSVAEFDKSIRDIVVTPANINTAAEKQAQYDALNIDNASIESAIANIEAKVNTFRATVQGGTIRGDADPEKQDLRYEYKAPTGSADGWYVKAYGALFIPESVLGNATLDVDNDDASGKQINLNAGESVPATFYANLTNSAIKQLRCETNIAGTAYVIWTNGTDEYVYYCNNEVNNSGYTENDTEGGIAVRSVYGIARKMAKAIYGTTEYGTVTYTEKVTAGGDVATFADADILTFVAANVEVITNYVGAKQ